MYYFVKLNSFQLLTVQILKQVQDDVLRFESVLIKIKKPVSIKIDELKKYKK